MRIIEELFGMKIFISKLLRYKYYKTRDDTYRGCGSRDVLEYSTLINTRSNNSTF